MIINGNSLFAAAPIKNMFREKKSNGDVSFGLSEAGYDIRIKQTILFNPWTPESKRPDGDGGYEPETDVRGFVSRKWEDEDGKKVGDFFYGRFCLASAIEEFQMPDNLVGIVHDKSTWARRGLSVFNTVIEPGWKGFLTLELVYHGNEGLIIPAGSGIAQVVFHKTSDEMGYTGKYQNQPDKPVGPRSR